MQRNMVTFRKMTEKDAGEVAALEKELFSDAWTANALCETLRTDRARIFVAEDNQEMIGYAILYYVLDEGELARIAVREDCQRQGVGCGLLETVCDFCMEKGVTRLLLEVRESNRRARTFYTKCGFAEDGVRKNFYQMPTEHAVLMSRAIPVLPTGRETFPTI